jgi:hypothetical protein
VEETGVPKENLFNGRNTFQTCKLDYFVVLQCTQHNILCMYRLSMNIFIRTIFYTSVCRILEASKKKLEIIPYR